MKEVSSGGVVVLNGRVLALKKYRGDWVLPKGRLEGDESLEEAALREVYEETGIKAEIVRYLGFVKYFYIHQNGEEVHKTVHYYYMKPAVNDAKLRPLRSERFAVADYIPFEKVIIKLRYGAEKNMVKTAMSFYGKQKKGRKK